MLRLTALLALVLAPLACTPSSSSEGEGEGEGGEGEGEVEFDDIDVSFVVEDAGGSGRDATVFVPSGYDGTTAMPLVLLLHGYGISGADMDRFTGFGAIAEEAGLLYASPDGTVDGSGENFWNASAACCDFFGSDVDDSAFLRGIIDGARARANVDAARIFVVGHSNGGFMAHKMACDHADVVAAAVSMAGAVDAAACDAAAPVAVLQVHGTDDPTVAYAGGNLGFGMADYPSAIDTAAAWAAINGCDEAAEDGGSADLALDIAGAETTIERFAGCDAGGAAELWTVDGAGHVVNGGAAFVGRLLDFLEEHHR